MRNEINFSPIRLYLNRDHDRREIPEVDIAPKVVRWIVSLKMVSVKLVVSLGWLWLVGQAWYKYECYRDQSVLEQPPRQGQTSTKALKSIVIHLNDLQAY